LDTNNLEPEIAFPSWLPQAARDTYGELCRNARGRGEHEAKIVGMLNRLFTSDEMRVIWTQLPTGDLYISKIFTFTDAVIDAYIGPWGTSTLTPSERQKKQTDISRTAKRLANLLRDTEYDWYLRYRKQPAYAKWVFESGHFGGGGKKSLSTNERIIILDLITNDCMSELLTEFANHFPDISNPPMQKPNDPQAARAYFVRELTNYFLQEFGGPRREWVATTTSVVLNDEKISVRQVTRLAPNPDGKLAKSTK
jgi:hypothetical protein